MLRKLLKKETIRLEEIENHLFNKTIKKDLVKKRI